jgi:hypothetical protein
MYFLHSPTALTGGLNQVLKFISRFKYTKIYFK